MVIIAAGMTALSFTGIPALGMSLVGAGVGIGQYAMDAAFHNQKVTMVGSITSVVLGGIFSFSAGASNADSIVKNMVSLSDEGMTAVGAITKATNRYASGKISKRGLQAVLNRYSGTAYRAVQAAVPGTVKKILINGVVRSPIVYVVNFAINNRLNEFFQFMGW